MLRLNIASLHLFIEVIDPQSEDGKPVDRTSRGFSIERPGRFDLISDEMVRDAFVHLLDTIVSLLIVQIDRSLSSCNPGIVATLAAGRILLMPQQKIKLMLRAGKFQKTVIGIVHWLMMPMGHHQIMHPGDLVYVIHVCQLFNEHPLSRGGSI